MNWKDAFGWRMCEPATAAAYGVLAAILFLPAAWGLQVLSDRVMQLFDLNPQEQAAVQELQDPTLTVTEKALMGVIAVVLAPVVEEALFRGILYPAIKRLGRPQLALWVSSALFAAMHFNMVTFVPLLVFALLLVYLYETFQNLLAPIVAQALFNAANFLILIFQDQIMRALHSHERIRIDRPIDSLAPGQRLRRGRGGGRLRGAGFRPARPISLVQDRRRRGRHSFHLRGHAGTNRPQGAGALPERHRGHGGTARWPPWSRWRCRRILPPISSNAFTTG